MPELPMTEASCLDCRAWVWVLETRGRHWPVKFDLEVRQNVQWFTIHRCGRAHPPQNSWPR